MKKREIISYILLILCVFVLFVIPWASVFGVKNEALIEAINVFQRYVGLFILLFIVLRFVYKMYGKSLPQEMREEEIKEADQKDKKQLLFKPTIGVIIIFLFLILIGISGFIEQVLQKPNENSFGYIVLSSFMIGISLWLWYNTPVFIFAEDSVQIKSFLFYVLGIDRKTMIKYADITSVEPDARMKSNFYRRYRIGISVRGTTKIWPAPFYNSDIIAKIYLRFREKLGDKVKLE
jgi:cytochrome b561